MDGQNQGSSSNYQNDQNPSGNQGQMENENNNQGQKGGQSSGMYGDQGRRRFQRSPQRGQSGKR